MRIPSSYADTRVRYRCASITCFTTARAEDLTQETFARAFRAIENHPPDRNFSAWIFKIANNAGVDHLRRKRLDTVPLENTPDVTVSGKTTLNAIQLANRALSTPTPPPRFRVRARAHAAEIEWAIQQLRKEYRVCVMLRFAEGRSYDDIAKVLDVPVGTAKSHMSRAKKELRRMLGYLSDDWLSDPGLYTRLRDQMVLDSFPPTA